MKWVLHNYDVEWVYPTQEVLSLHAFANIVKNFLFS